VRATGHHDLGARLDRLVAEFPLEIRGQGLIAAADVQKHHDQVRLTPGCCNVATECLGTCQGRASAPRPRCQADHGLDAARNQRVGSEVPE